MCSLNKIACVVNSPFQLYSIFNIIASIEKVGEPFDFYIVDKSLRPYLKVISDNETINIIDLSWFFEFKQRANKILTWFGLFCGMISQIYKTKKHTSTYYASVYVSSPSIPVMVLLSRMRNLNRSICVKMYDDGIRTYSGFGEFRHSLTESVFKIVYGFDFYSVINDLYLYQPDLFKKEQIYDKIKIHKIEINIDSPLLKQIVLNYTKDYEAFKEKRVIFFDQYMTQSKNKELSYEIEILKLVCNVVGKKNVIFKIHPRAINSNNLSLPCDISNSILPFELFLAKIPDINNTIFISVASSACMMPKLTFNKEPQVIMLYKLFSRLDNDNNSYSNLDSFVHKIKSSYNNPDDFIIPNNIKELDCFLHKAI